MTMRVELHGACELDVMGVSTRAKGRARASKCAGLADAEHFN